MPSSVAPVIVSTAQLGAILGMSARRVQQLREEGMPRAGHGKWDLMVAIPWYLEHIERQAKPRDKSTEEARRRYEQARAGIFEHKEAETKGRALTQVEHKAIVSELCADIASTIESFPVREYSQPHERAQAFRICHTLRERLGESVSRAGLVRRKRGRGKASVTAPDEERESMGGTASDAATA